MIQEQIKVIVNAACLIQRVTIGMDAFALWTRQNGLLKLAPNGVQKIMHARLFTKQHMANSVKLEFLT